MPTFRLEERTKGRDSDQAPGGPGAAATSVSEALINVLNERRSPLSFRVQLLALHLHPVDGLSSSLSDGKGPGVLLVAKRRVCVACDEAPSMGDCERMAADIDREQGASQTLPAAAAGAGSKRHLSVSPRHPQDGGNKNGRMRVVEEDELGRVGPFSIHSTTTVLSASSFTIPSSALVANTQRRRGSDDPAIQIVLEIIHDTNDNGGGGKRGSAFTRGKPTPFLKKQKLRSKSSNFDGNEDGDGRFVARAILDAEFLRRTIACQRSIEMMTTSVVAGEAVASFQSEKKGESLPVVPFARLDVAGHVVGARPGRPRLRLEVLECQNLRSTDILGKSDPCVLVFWEGVEIGRTPIACDLHPIFSAAGSTFRLPLVPPMSTTTNLDPTNPLTWNGGRRSTTNWLAYAPELRLEVWDMDRDTFSRKWKQGDLLGIVTLHGPGGIAPVIDACTVQTSGITQASGVDRMAPASILRLRTDRSLSKHGSAEDKSGQGSNGVISIKIAVENATDDSEEWISQASASTAAAPGVSEAELQTATFSTLDLSPPPTLQACSPDAKVDAETEVTAHLEIRCLDARGLPLGCDGYCRVFWNGRQVGSTLPASSRFAQGMNESARSNILSALQRNPVWWASLAQASSYAEHVDQNSGFTSSDATAIVRLCENPTVEDELTLEVFDGMHMQEISTKMVANRRASGEHYIEGEGATDASPNSNVVGATPGKANKVRRDLLGRSLGSVTVRGKYLLNPPRGRIDLPLLIPSTLSQQGNGTAGATLSISLVRLLFKKKIAGSMTRSATAPRSKSATPEKGQYSDRISAILGTTTATTPTNRGKGAPKASLNGEESDAQRPTRWLRLLLQGAHLLKGLDISGTSDPFCTVYVDRIWFSETRVCWGTLSPRWDQWIQIEVSERGRALAMTMGLVGHEIRVEVWDKDLVGANDFIGEVHLFLHENQDG